ncbi:LysR family transcriptional regulator [Chelativorans alearense]|uniref:LysR family transcriptional regulator n=1 Tax=Chelativorans alearense TaxID=2681495 RepID=UPI0013D0FA15|nr:LysR family transcriptional regulator [Chelativorans alearense]
MKHRQIDLNLLRVFDVLMEERSVSRAASRLGLTQSSTSNALDRLRRSLGDRILEREGNGMVPTRAAIELWPHVQSAIRQIDLGLEALARFNPSRLRATFSIGIDEYSLTLMGAGLMAALKDKAPHVKLAFLPATPQQNAEELFAGALDLIIGPVWQAFPGLERAVLLHETFVGLADAGHPLFRTAKDGSGPSVEDYVRFPHLLVSQRGLVRGNVDAGLHKIGYRRKVAVTIPSYASAPAFLTGSELILNLGRRLAGKVAASAGLKIFALPLDVPGFDIAALWHPRNTASKSHNWLRGQMREVCSRL